MELITSIHNEKIKNIIHLLQRGRERERQNLIVVDGQREIELALKSGLHPDSLFYCSEYIDPNKKFFIINQENDEIIRAFRGYSVTAEVFDKIAYAENPDGWLALFEPRYSSFDDLKLSDCPLLGVLEAVEKPGNLGAMLRTAYAAGVEAIILNGQTTDIYNPNVTRASMGHIFTVPVVQADFNETKTWLKSKGIRSFAAALPATKNYTEVDFSKPSAIVLGTESEGLSENWLEGADELVKIPMRSGIDSLNVSVSAGILFYEASRQRGRVDF